MTLRSEFLTAGRLGRAGFWLRHASTVPVGFWIVIAAGQSPGAPYDLPLVIALVAMLASIWGRRLHDRGHSAWWLLAAAVPVLGALGLMVECGLRGSSPKAERYGPPTGQRADYLTVGEGQAA